MNARGFYAIMLYGYLSLSPLRKGQTKKEANMKLVTHYDYDLLHTFFQFSLMRNKKGKNRKTTFWACSTIGLVGSILFFFMGNSRVLFAILAVAILMIDLFVGYQLLTITKRAQKRQPGMFEAVNEYEFEAKQVIVRSLVDGAEEIRVKYDELLRAVETPTAFYLYISPGSAFIVNKREMTESEGEQLSNLLNKKMQYRFSFRKN